LDYRDFYSCRGLALIGAGLGTASILAHSTLDEDFQRWHDREVKSSGSDDFAHGVRWLGDGRIMIPVFACASLLECRSVDIDQRIGVVGQWGNRCLRSAAVGAPAVLALKYLLNASRPEDENTSRWRPFDSPYSEGAVSGHAFIGAIPFVNAAKMTDNLGAKAILYTASTLPAWSRINDRKHYLSQAMLGWWLAYLAADSVACTENCYQSFTLVPQVSAGGFACQAVYRW
jgi:hypothetical protein